MHSGVGRSNGQRFAQDGLALPVAAEAAIQIGEVHKAGHRTRCERDRRAVFGLRLLRLAPLREERAESDARFGPIGVEPLHFDIWRIGLKVRNPPFCDIAEGVQKS